MTFGFLPVSSAVRVWPWLSPEYTMARRAAAVPAENAVVPA
jgi:hypothetical protein